MSAAVLVPMAASSISGVQASALPASTRTAPAMRRAWWYSTRTLLDHDLVPHPAGVREAGDALGVVPGDAGGCGEEKAGRRARRYVGRLDADEARDVSAGEGVELGHVHKGAGRLGHGIQDRLRHERAARHRVHASRVDDRPDPEPCVHVHAYPPRPLCRRPASRQEARRRGIRPPESARHSRSASSRSRALAYSRRTCRRVKSRPPSPPTRRTSRRSRAWRRPATLHG